MMDEDRGQSFVRRMAELFKMPEEDIRREIKDIAAENGREERARNARLRLLEHAE